jgi:hypothetical protein
VALDPQRGVLGDDAAKHLGFLNRLARWCTYLQRSLNSVPDVDGSKLVEMLGEPRDAVPIVVPARGRKPRATRDADGPEPTPIETHAQPLAGYGVGPQ